MTDRNALSLGLKVAGFAWAVRCVSTLYSTLRSLCFVNMSFYGEKVYSPTYPLRVFGYLVVTVLITICFFAFSDRLAKLIIKHEKELSVKTIFGAAVALTGIVFVAVSLLSLYSSLMEVICVGENQTAWSKAWIASKPWGPLVQSVVTLMIGPFLAYRPGYIVDLVYNHKISEPE
ncbi:hypothetical protein LLG46_02635 [bacterium]|nr:hypothetical protein [bacterium]